MKAHKVYESLGDTFKPKKGSQDAARKKIRSVLKPEYDSYGYLRYDNLDNYELRIFDKKFIRSIINEFGWEFEETSSYVKGKIIVNDEIKPKGFENNLCYVSGVNQESFTIVNLETEEVQEKYLSGKLRDAKNFRLPTKEEIEKYNLKGLRNTVMIQKLNNEIDEYKSDLEYHKYMIIDRNKKIKEIKEKIKKYGS